MREDKWNRYMNIIQGHGGIAETNKSTKLLSYVQDLLPKGKCLVIGCADGNEVKALNDLGYDCIGITLGSQNVEHATKNLGLDVREMDFHDLDFHNDTFEAAYSSHSFEHVFAPIIHCLEVWSVLKANGKWLIEMPLCTPEDIYGPNQLDHHHPNLYPREYHKKLFEICGFKAEPKPQKKKAQRHNDWILTKDHTLTGVHSTVQLALRNRIK